MTIRPDARWLALTIGPVVGLWWSKGHVLPLAMAGAFSLAFVLMALAGRVAQDILDGPAPPAEDAQSPGLFQLLWLGQYAVFAASLVITPVAALLADRTGWHVPLRFSLGPVVVGLSYLAWRKRRVATCSALPLDLSSFALAGLVAIAFYRGLSLHAFHAGALGHDTQQHIYWAQHIADFGFLPVTARGSDLLDAYPKFFHLVAACWSALGLSGTVGPFVKMMPFLQCTLACGFGCELLLKARRTQQAADGWLAAVALGAFSCWHLTYGDGQEIYAVKDLSGTARFGAGWLLFGPPLLVLAHGVGTFRDLRSWLIGLLPVFGAVAFGVNPVLFVFYASCSVPFAVTLLACQSTRGLPRKLPWPRALGLGCLVALLCLLATPLILQLLSANHTFAAALGWFGVRTSAAGIAGDAWSGMTAPLCSNGLLECARQLGEGTVADTVGAYRTLLGARRSDAFADATHPAIYALTFATPLVLAGLRWRAARPTAGAPPAGWRLSAGLLLGQLALLLLHPLVNSLLGRIGVASPLLWLLWQYYNPLNAFWGSWLRCMLAASTWAVLPALPSSRTLSTIAFATAATLATASLRVFKLPDLAANEFARPSLRVDWPELRAIEHLNEFVPSHETVLIPGRHMHILNREHMLIADSPAGMIVPHITTRILFGNALGTGTDYGWADLEYRFCATAEERTRLLREANVRWALVRAHNPRSRRALSRRFWLCTVTLTDLGAEYPPAWSEEDLALYRINP